MTVTKMDVIRINRERREFDEAHRIFAQAEYAIEKIFWQAGNAEIGNLVGDMAELRSKYRKIFLDIHPQYSEDFVKDKSAS